MPEVPTHRKIPDGTIDAIASGRMRTAVGLPEPRDRRPGC